MKTRTRLSPEARRRQLLDVAKEIILADGLQAFSMEALARQANVSSPLVYNYFQSRKNTLQCLLVEEYNAYTARLTKAAAAADSFEDMVLVFIQSNFDHFAPGNIMPILDSQPEIVEAIKQSSREHGKQIARLLVRSTATTYQLTKADAALVVSISSGASIAAARHAANQGVDRDKAVNTALRYILAGLACIGQRK